MTNFEKDDAALNEVLGEVMGPEYADPVVAVDDRKHFGRFARTSNDGLYDGSGGLSMSEPLPGNRTAPKQEGVVATATEGAAQRARRLFGLTGTYSLVQAHDPSGAKVPDQFFIRHDDTGTFTSDHSVRRYGLLQLDVLDLIELASPGTPIDRGFNWNNWKQVGLQTRLGTFVGPTGLSYESRATILNDYTGSASLQLWLTDVCLACQNQKAQSWAGAKFKWKIRHTAKVEEKIDLLKLAMANAGDQTRKMQGALFAWDKVSITHDAVRTMVAEWLPKKKDKATGKDTDVLTKLGEERLLGAMDAYEHADGAAPGSLYGVVQMGTFLASNYFTGPAGLRGVTSGVGGDFVKSMYESVNTRFTQETGSNINEVAQQHVLVLN